MILLIGVLIVIYDPMIAQIRRGCAISLQSGTLINSLVFATMVLLVFSSIVIISIISVTPVVMLAIGELGSGQRDIILQPRLDYINATRITEVAAMPAMPRIKTYLEIDGRANAMGWLMDFQLERDNHLGTIGGNEPPQHSLIYAH
jgi:hypothetical protein